jgi:hypothetical protein
MTIRARITKMISFYLLERDFLLLAWKLLPRKLECNLPRARNPFGDFIRFGYVIAPNKNMRCKKITTNRYVDHSVS